VPAVSDFAHDHVARSNEAVGSGDWSDLVATFHPEATMEFAGPPVGPFRGRDAIAAAYEAHPPDDTMRIRSVSRRGPADVVAFEWSRGGTGTMEIHRANGLITPPPIVRFDQRFSKCEVRAAGFEPAQTSNRFTADPNSPTLARPQGDVRAVSPGEPNHRPTPLNCGDMMRAATGIRTRDLDDGNVAL
jgi:steroid Delta-isomerase